MSDQGEKQEGQKDPKTEEKILFVQEDLHPDEDSRKRNSKLAALCIMAVLFVVGGVFLAIFLGSNFGKKGSNKPLQTTTQTGEEVTQVQTVGESTTEATGTSAKPIVYYEDDVETVYHDGDMTLNLLKLENGRKNTIYSPLSVKYALSMLSDGAGGNTKAQIDKLLAGNSVTKYNDIQGVLSLASSIWVNNRARDVVKTEYIDLLKQKYNAELKFDDFTSVGNINNWCSEKTFNMIPNALGEISESNTFFLINALAIDMDWEHRFDASNTNSSSFYVKSEDDTNALKVAMMNDSISNRGNEKGEYPTRIGYYFGSDATLLAIDLKKYENTQLQFVAVMPLTQELRNFVATTSMNKINDLIAKLQPVKSNSADLNITLNYHIPKFKYDGGLAEFKKDLQQLGVTDVFGDNADLSNMAPGNNISEAIHKATIDFNEEGIKAAAVTIMGGKGAGGGYRMPNTEIINLYINKPFFYVIRDKSNGEVWFLGTVYEPTLWESAKSEYKY